MRCYETLVSFFDEDGLGFIRDDSGALLFISFCNMLLL